MLDLTTFLTKDGSTSLYHSKLNETYHSRHGSLNEARHVFINAGIEHFIQLNQQKEEISIFEMGFGTGLNCLLTALWAHDNTSVRFNYLGLENNILSNEQIDSCNYTKVINHPLSNNYFKQIHSIDWNVDKEIHPFFKLKKLENSIENINYNAIVDLVFYDAFGPSVQPTLWGLPVLKIVYDLLKPNGIFVTYCAKGSVRRALVSLGFKVERIKGPPGKREMLRATK